MRVTVLAVEESGSAVTCRTPAGELLVRWRGAAMPVAGDAQDVELDAVGELAWGVEVGPAAGTTFGEGRGVLVGVLESIDGRSAVLRVGPSIVLMETTDPLPLTASGQPVFVRPERWDAWPTGV